MLASITLTSLTITIFCFTTYFFKKMARTITKAQAMAYSTSALFSLTILILTYLGTS